jgi:hypothetical protein
MLYNLVIVTLPVAASPLAAKNSQLNGMYISVKNSSRDASTCTNVSQLVFEGSTLNN